MYEDNNNGRPRRPMYDQQAAARRAEERERQAGAAQQTTGRQRMPENNQPRQRLSDYERAQAPRQAPQAARQQYAGTRGQTVQRQAVQGRDGGTGTGSGDRRRTAQQRGSSTQQARAKRPPARGGTYARRKQKRKHTVIVVLLLVLAMMGVLVFGFYNAIMKTISGKNSGQGELPNEIQTMPEWTGKGIVNFLVCGLDYDDEEASGYTTDEKIGKTDMILYVHYDTVANKASILQLPRDIYVGDKVKTGGTGRINGLYYYAEDIDNRVAALATVIYEQFRLPIDFYVTIDMDAVKDLIDNATGPIEVYIPVDIIEPKSGDTIPAGWTWLDGEAAEFVLRNRKSPTYQEQADVARLQTQQYFYSALYREFSQLAPSDLVMWMRVLVYRVKTDMDTAGEVVQLGGLAQKALNLTGEDITFVRPAVSGAYHNEQSLLSLVPDEFADLLNEYFRPEGESYSVNELNIQTLPVIESMGIHETSIRTMGDIQDSEG